MLTLREMLSKNETEATDTRNWSKVGHAMGSNPGGVYADESGNHHYVKHSHTYDHAHNEILANKMYQHLGVPTLEPSLIRHSKGLGVASPMRRLESYNPHDKDHVKEVNKHFASHAFLANWDAAGLVNDNQAKVGGKMTTLDAGGALKFRAQGSPKGNLFGDKVNEWDTLRNPSMNPTSAHAFNQMSPHDMVNSSKAVANFKNSDIHSLVHKHGPGDFNEKTDLVNKMIARKKDVISRANQIAKTHGIKTLNDIDE